MNIDNLANLSEALINLIRDIFNALYTTIIDTPTASAAVTASDMHAFKVSMIVIVIMILLLIYAQHGGKKAKK